MSRSGYIEDCTDWSLICYRGRVASAVRGKRGQRLLLDLVRALDGMEKKELIAHELVNGDNVCALGAVGVSRGLDLTNVDPDDPETVAGLFDIADCLAREVVFINDEGGRHDETPAARWLRVRNWAASKIQPVLEPTP